MLCNYRTSEPNKTNPAHKEKQGNKIVPVRLILHICQSFTAVWQSKIRLLEAIPAAIRKRKILLKMLRGQRGLVLRWILCILVQESVQLTVQPYKATRFFFFELCCAPCACDGKTYITTRGVQQICPPWSLWNGMNSSKILSEPSCSEEAGNNDLSSISGACIVATT